jgi:hypothetical protein
MFRNAVYNISYNDFKVKTPIEWSAGAVDECRQKGKTIVSVEGGLGAEYENIHILE